MNILDLPNEILDYITSYLNLTEIRNLKLSNSDLAFRIQNYQIDLSAVQSCLFELDALTNIENLKKRYKSFYIKDFRFYIDDIRFYIDDDTNYKLILEIPKIIVKIFEKNIYELGFSFYGYTNMIEEDQLYYFDFQYRQDKLLEIFIQVNKLLNINMKDLKYNVGSDQLKKYFYQRITKVDLEKFINFYTEKDN